jgi:hypothetical protein
LNRFVAIRCAINVSGGSGLPTAIVVGACSVLTWDSMEERGSMDMPRAMEGLGSMREVACAFPFRANIADGLELVRLRLEHEERAKGGKYPPSNWNGFPGH